MKYIISERQYNLLTEQEEKVLRIPFAAFGNDWDDLQLFLKHRGNPPYEIMDNLDLDLSESDVKSLGNLTSVGGYLYLYESNIEDLGNLTSVGGYLDLSNTKIKSIGKLKSVGGYLDLSNTPIKSIGNLISVEGYLNLEDTPLSKKYSEEEIRSMIEVGGKVYL
jgi:hypothetical protein